MEPDREPSRAERQQAGPGSGSRGPGHRAHCTPAPPLAGGTAAQRRAGSADGAGAGLGPGDDAGRRRSFRGAAPGSAGARPAAALAELLVPGGREPMPAPQHWDQRAAEEGLLPAERLHPSRGPCAVAGREARAVPRPEPPAGAHRPPHRDPGGVQKVLPPDETEQVAVKRGTKASLTTVVKETSCLMMRMQGVSHMLAHPLRGISARCVVQFVGGRPSTAESGAPLGRFSQKRGCWDSLSV